MGWSYANILLSKTYKKLGYIVAQRPLLFIIVPIIITGILSSGFHRVRYEQDFKYLYNPTDSESVRAKKLVEDKFRMNYSTDFDLGRMSDFNNMVLLIITANDGGSMLRKDMFERVLEINKIMEGIKLNKDNRTWSYNDLCAKNGKYCFRNEILTHGIRISNVHKGYRIIKYPITTSAYTIIPYSSNLGGVTVDEYDYVTSAKAVRLLYVLDATDPQKTKLNEEWEDLFLTVINNITADNITIYKFSSNAVKWEFTRTVLAAIPLYVILVIIMVIFSIITCCTTDWIVSKPWLGIIGIISVVLALGSGFGFVIYCGFPFIDISLTVPFLLLGIGIDDTFVMLAAWRHTNTNASVSERLAETYAESAISITVTSLTNFICVCIGMATPFPAIKIFCIFAASSIFMSYVFQLTFFGGWLALCGQAEKNRRHGFFFFKIKENCEDNSQSFLKRYLCNGGQSLSSTFTSPFVYIFTLIGRYMKKTVVRMIIIMIFSIYLAFGAYFSTQLEEGVSFEKFFPYDSFIGDFFTADIKYFSKYKSRIQIIVNTPMNYADPEVQNSIENLLNDIESSPFMTTRLFTESWLREFLKLQNDFTSYFYLQKYNLSSEIEFNKALREVFFQIPEVSRLKNDVEFDETGTKITASRFLVQSNITNTVEEEKQMLLDLRRIGNKYPFEIHYLQYMFPLLDQFLMVSSVTFQAITVTAITMIAIFAVFIPNIVCVVLAGFIVTTIEICVIGYMTVWNVKLDTVAMLNLIICIGFSIDYIAHLSHSYILCRRKNKKHGIELTLQNIGMPIFQGCASTILSIIPLAFGSAYIFLCFFKIVFLVIMFATLNALFLLPVLFSLAERFMAKLKKRQKFRTDSKRRMLSFRKSLKEEIGDNT